MVSICPYISMTHRIHGAATYGVPWIPSIYPSHVSRYTSTSRIRHGCLVYPWSFERWSGSWTSMRPQCFAEVSDPAGYRPLQRRVGRMAPSETLRSIQGARSPWIDEWGKNLEFINKEIEKKNIEDLGFSSNKSVKIEDIGFLLMD
jgi:hypothetical protein